MKIHGQVAMWRYRQARSGYRGFHTTADPAGAASMMRALTQIKSGDELSVPLVQITPAILSVPNNTRDQAVGYSRLVMRAVVDGGVQRFTHSHPTLTLEAPREALAEMAKGYEAVAAHEGDFTIGPDDHNLWFWWWPTRG